jgi:hypothetical protein
MSDFRIDGFGKIFIIAFLSLIVYGIGKFAIWISKPKEFVVTKKIKSEKRIVTDGIKVDTVLVYKFP